MSRRSSRVRRTNIQNNTQKYSGKWGLQGLVDCRARNKVLCQYIKRRADGSQSVSSPSPPAPSAITDLVATAIGFPVSGTDPSGTSITIQLTWTPPSGTITDYEYKVNSGAWISTGSAIQPYDYSGVVGGGEYTFMIRAKNGVSVGNDSNLSNAITAPTAQFQTRAEIIAAISAPYSLPDIIATYNSIDNWKFKNTITDFSSLFASNTSFNTDISNWDISSITDMNNLFNGATAFNQDLSTWNLSSISLSSGLDNCFNQSGLNGQTWNSVTSSGGIANSWYTKVTTLNPTDFFTAGVTGQPELINDPFTITTTAANPGGSGSVDSRPWNTITNDISGNLYLACRLSTGPKVMKSINGGASWDFKNDFLVGSITADYANMSITSNWIDPSNNIWITVGGSLAATPALYCSRSPSFIGTPWPIFSTENADPTLDRGGSYPSIVADINGNTAKIYISYQRYGTKLLYFVRSDDGGENFETPVNIPGADAPDPPGPSPPPQDHFTGISTSISTVQNGASTHVFISWVRWDNPVFSLMFTKSTNDGTSFAVPSNLGASHGPFTVAFATSSTSIQALDNNNIYILYTKDDQTLCLLKSTDGGANWASPIVIISDPVIENMSDMVIIGTGNINTTKIYISYHYGPADAGLGCAFSNDNGTTFFTKNITGITNAKFNSITALSNSNTAYISSVGATFLCSKVEINGL